MGIVEKQRSVAPVGRPKGAPVASRIGEGGIQEHKHSGAFYWHPADQTHAWERRELTPQEFREKHPDFGLKIPPGVESTEEAAEREVPWEIMAQVHEKGGRYWSMPENPFHADLTIGFDGANYKVFHTKYPRMQITFPREKDATEFVRAIFEQQTFGPKVSEELQSKVITKGFALIPDIDNFLELSEENIVSHFELGKFEVKLEKI